MTNTVSTTYNCSYRSRARNNKLESEAATAKPTSPEAEIWQCSDTACSAAFASSVLFLLHTILTTTRGRRSESLFDVIRHKWADKYMSVSSSSALPAAIPSCSTATPSSIPRRWALKTIQKFKRFSDKVKTYLLWMFSNQIELLHQQVYTTLQTVFSIWAPWTPSFGRNLLLKSRCLEIRLAFLLAAKNRILLWTKICAGPGCIEGNWESTQLDVPETDVLHIISSHNTNVR